MKDFYYVYILESETDGKNYAGYTQDLNLRFEQDNKGNVESTKHLRPFKMIGSTVTLMGKVKTCIW